MSAFQRASSCVCISAASTKHHVLERAVVHWNCRSQIPICSTAEKLQCHQGLELRFVLAEGLALSGDCGVQARRLLLRPFYLFWEPNADRKTSPTGGHLTEK